MQSNAPQKEELNIFNYDDHKKYLLDYYNYYKSNTSFFSYRYFSQKAGFSSSGVLKKVIDGKRRIGLQSIKKFCHALNLSGDQAEYFEYLVLYNQCKNRSEKSALLKEMLKFSGKVNIALLSEAQMLLYSEWYHPVILELLMIKDFKDDYSALAGILNPPITPEQAEESVHLLKQIGLLYRNGEGVLVSPVPVSKTPEEERQKPYINSVRLKCLKMGIAACEQYDMRHQHHEQLILGISEDGLQKIKRIVETMCKDIIKIYSEDKGKDVVYQINLHIYPLTTVSKASQLRT